MGECMASDDSMISIEPSDRVVGVGEDGVTGGKIAEPSATSSSSSFFFSLCTSVWSPSITKGSSFSVEELDVAPLSDALSSEFVSEKICSCLHSGQLKCPSVWWSSRHPW